MVNGWIQDVIKDVIAYTNVSESVTGGNVRGSKGKVIHVMTTRNSFQEIAFL